MAKRRAFCRSKSSNGLLVFNFLFFAGKFSGVEPDDGMGPKKDYVLLHVMRIPAAQHYRSQMVLKGVKDTICFLVPLLWFGFRAESVLFVVSLFFTRYIGHAGILQHYRHSETKGKKCVLEVFGKNIFSVWNHISTRIWSGGSSSEIVFG